MADVVDRYIRVTFYDTEVGGPRPLVTMLRWRGNMAACVEHRVVGIGPGAHLEERVTRTIAAGMLYGTRDLTPLEELHRRQELGGLLRAAERIEVLPASDPAVVTYGPYGSSLALKVETAWGQASSTAWASPNLTPLDPTK